PEMLGSLKDQGIITKLLMADKARKVDEQLVSFNNNLRQYMVAQKQMEEIQSRLTEKYFSNKINAINEEIHNLQSQIASKSEKEFVTSISKIESSHTSLGKLDENKFTKDISILFREDKVVDLLFNWEVYQGKIAALKTKDGALEEEFEDNNKRYSQKTSRLDFNEVASKLSSTHYERIFRAYAR